MYTMKRILLSIVAICLLITTSNGLTLQGQVHRGNSGWGKRDLSAVSRVSFIKFSLFEIVSKNKEKLFYIVDNGNF